MEALPLFDEPQGHRHDVSVVRDFRGRDRGHPVDPDALRASGARHPDLPRPGGHGLWRRGRRLDRCRQAHVQRVRHRARPAHDLLHGHAGDDRRLWQLVRAVDDRRAGHGLPAHEQRVLLAAAAGSGAAAHLDVRRRSRGRPWRRRRLDDLSAAVDHRPARPGDGLRHPGAPHRRRVIDPRRHQLHHHDLQHARPPA